MVMGETALRNEDKIGLAAAVVLHGVLVAVLLLQTVRSEVPVFPERMTVSLATEVGLEAASPDPVAESRAAIAPTLSDDPVPAPDPVRPERAERAAATTPRARNTRTPAPKPSAAPAKPAESGGGSRIGDDFLGGSGSSTTTQETRIPASQIGASAKASIGQALARQVKPHWTAPQGLEVDQIVTLVDFDLNPDGSLNGRPRVRNQSGINDANRAQAARHAENAIRAVHLAAPFDLPAEYYEAWKTVRGARFDRNTSR